MIRAALTSVLLFILLAACSAPAPEAPQKLDLGVEVLSGGYWWITSPEAALSDYTSAQVDLEFENITALDVEFKPEGPSVTDDDRLQLWVGSGPTFEDAPFTLTSFPTTTMAPGETVTYSISVDIAGLVNGGRFLAIRPQTVTLGTTGPSSFRLVSGTATLTP